MLYTKLHAPMTLTICLFLGLSALGESNHSAPMPAHKADNAHHAAAHGPSADTALGWLKNGNTRFRRGTSMLRKDGQSAGDRQRLEKGQHPHTIVLSCSDSRVPPEVVFDQKLGEIFVVRVAGEALDSSVIASLEYAVEHLGAKLMIVMGHESCGAVKAAFQTPSDKSAGSADLDKLVSDIRPRLPKSSQASANFVHESTVNAQGVAKDLLKRSALLQKKVMDGHLKVVPAMYMLGSGQVNFFE